MEEKVDSGNKDIDKLVDTKLGRKLAFQLELEELVKYFLQMKSQFYRLTAKDIKIDFHLTKKFEFFIHVAR